MQPPRPEVLDSPRLDQMTNRTNAKTGTLSRPRRVGLNVGRFPIVVVGEESSVTQPLR
jgi:hypothetical protein